MTFIFFVFYITKFFMKVARLQYYLLEKVIWRSFAKVFLQIHRKKPTWNSQPTACNVKKGDSNARVFLWILQKFRNSFFVEHLWATASANALQNKIKIIRMILINIRITRWFIAKARSTHLGILWTIVAKTLGKLSKKALMVDFY